MNNKFKERYVCDKDLALKIFSELSELYEDVRLETHYLKSINETNYIIRYRFEK